MAWDKITLTQFHGSSHLRKPRVLSPLRSLGKERSGLSTLGLRRWVVPESFTTCVKAIAELKTRIFTLPSGGCLISAKENSKNILFQQKVFSEGATDLNSK